MSYGPNSAFLAIEVTAMAIEFGVIRQDRPGTLAQLGRLLSDARVNIEAIQGTSREGKGAIQFVVNDSDKTARAPRRSRNRPIRSGRC